MNAHEHNIDKKSRTVYVIGDIDEERAAEFVKNIHMLDRRPGTIRVHLSTQGGDIDAGILMYQTMVAAKSVIHVHAMGVVESAGVFLLQGGCRRIVGPMTMLMYHSGTISVDEKAPQEAMRLLDAACRSGDLMDNVIYDRISKVAPITRKMFDAQVKESFVIEGKEIVDAGYADECVQY